MTSSTSGIPVLLALKRDLICGYHILDHDGQASGIAGHLSARLPGANTFWSHRWGHTFGEVRATDLQEADFDLNPVSGDGAVNPTMHIHTRIYLARPDVNCIVHTHGSGVLALSAVGGRIEMCTQPAAIFLDEIDHFDEYEGVVLGKGEGDILASALGGRRGLVLRQHGQLIAGGSIGEAVFLAVRLEFVARIQLAAMQTGRPLEIMLAAMARQAHGFFWKSDNIRLQWAALQREILRCRPGILDGL